MDISDDFLTAENLFSKFLLCNRASTLRAGARFSCAEGDGGSSKAEEELATGDKGGEDTTETEGVREAEGTRETEDERGAEDAIVSVGEIEAVDVTEAVVGATGAEDVRGAGKGTLTLPPPALDRA